MKICLAQIQTLKGDMEANSQKHQQAIALAQANQAEAIFFSELSLTGYEPELAKDLALDPTDARLDIFQQMADNQSIIIGLGAPTRSSQGILISMLIFQPGQARQIYSKQHLHTDELPFFVAGMNQIILSAQDIQIAPAICYESLLAAHSENAYRLGAKLYLASVAKSANGVQKALKHYPAIAQKFGIWVLMVNCVGFCDNFLSTGTTSAWNPAGDLLGQLNEESEGLLFIDTQNETGIGLELGI
jgi:predicted amidohydrolase